MRKNRIFYNILPPYPKVFFLLFNLTLINEMLDSYFLNLMTAFFILATVNQYTTASIIFKVARAINSSSTAEMNDLELMMYSMEIALGKERWDFVCTMVVMMIISSVLSFIRIEILNEGRRLGECICKVMSLFLLAITINEYMEGPDDSLKEYEFLLGFFITMINTLALAK